MAKKAETGRAPLTVSLLGSTVPMPRWTLSWMRVLILLGFAAIIARHLGFDADELWRTGTLKELELAQQEYSRHMWEEPAQTYAAPGGVFTIKAFADHCIAIQRKLGNEVRTRLVPDLALEPERRGALGAAPAFDLVAVAVDALVPALEAQGRCPARHEGRFKTWNGQKQGCRVQVWRQWPDGCTHYQMMNACNGAWDTNPDGSPRVIWTVCRH
jgi:hypothetical protein